MRTADTITDEIRSLLVGADLRTRILCKLALGEGATYLRTHIMADARKRCALLFNARKGV